MGTRKRIGRRFVPSAGGVRPGAGRLTHQEVARLLRDVPANVSAVPIDRGHTEYLVRPPGTIYDNPHGMRFMVLKYVPIGFTCSPGPAYRQGDMQVSGAQPPVRLLPVVAHLNPSKLLLRLYHQVNMATPKEIMYVDAAGLPEHSRQIMEGLHSADWRREPTAAVITIDSNVCREGILAHELMHIRLDLIEGFEDHRRYRQPDDGEKSFLVMAAQSFVIDCKVQEKLKERGFPVRQFAEDVVAALHETAVALDAGMRFKNNSQAAVLARTLARPWAVPEIYDFTSADWGKIEAARNTFEKYACKVVQLADRLIAAFKLHGWAEKAGAMKLIDECLRLHFAFLQEAFDLERDLVVEPERVEYRDKFPDALQNVPVREKYDIYRKLIREKWPDGTGITTTWLGARRLHVAFRRPEAEAKAHKTNAVTQEGDEEREWPFKYDG